MAPKSSRRAYRNGLSVVLHFKKNLAFTRLEHIHANYYVLNNICVNGREIFTRSPMQIIHNSGLKMVAGHMHTRKMIVVGEYKLTVSASGHHHE